MKVVAFLTEYADDQSLTFRPGPKRMGCCD